jgi:ABC-type transporter Mla maintaining outer membrane lipid asymmetry ATPase subunit MlaF
LVALRQAAAGNVGAATGKSLDLRVTGATPNPEAGRSVLDGRYPDGRTVRMQSAVFARGTVVYQATALGERLDASALDTFFTSLRFPS